MKGKTIYVTRKKGDKPKLGKTDLARLNKMSEEELTANALSDPDNPPMTKEELRRMRRVYPGKKMDIKLLRHQMGLSQEEFADYFGISVRTLQDWEQQRTYPNKASQNFLVVISKKPKMVRQILGLHSKSKHIAKHHERKH